MALIWEDMKVDKEGNRVRAGSDIVCKREAAGWIWIQANRSRAF